MATKTWPAALRVSAVDLSCPYNVQMNVYVDGHLDTVGLPGARWTVTIGFDPLFEERQAPLRDALVMSLEGGKNRLSMPVHWQRLVPRGSLRGSPTLQTGAAPGVNTVALTNCNGGLFAGDLIGIVDQVVMVESDVAPTGGNMTVTFHPPLRKTRNSGTPITWDRPAVLWIPRSNVAGPFPYRPNGLSPSMSLELVEAF